MDIFRILENATSVFAGFFAAAIVYDILEEPIKKIINKFKNKNHGRK